MSGRASNTKGSSATISRSSKDLAETGSIRPPTKWDSIRQPRSKRRHFSAIASASTAISPPGVTTYEEEQSRQLFLRAARCFTAIGLTCGNVRKAKARRSRARSASRACRSRPGGMHASTLGGWGFAIARTIPPQRASVAVRAVSRGFAAGESRLRKDRHAAGAEDFYDDNPDPAIQQMYTVFQSAVPRPMTPQYAQASDILQRHLERRDLRA